MRGEALHPAGRRVTRDVRGLLAGIIVALGLSGAFSADAQSPDAALKPFFGSFSGRAIAGDPETPPGTSLKVRDLDVVIRPAGAGFVLTWGTALSHRRDGPHSHYRVTTYAFEPDSRPNWFRATEVGDPLHGRPLIWARLEHETLYVSIYTVFEDGHNDLQIYARKVVGDRMDVTYSRSHENDRITVVRGWLIRRSD